MFEIQKLKQQVYKDVEESGLFRQVQAQLKTQVLNNLQSQASAKQNAMGFSYQHPLLPKLQKYNITHICLDLIQEFLESFKFQYTLSVFMKEVNRTGKINRDKLGEQLNIESNQAVLLTAVEILRNGGVVRKKESVYLGVLEGKRPVREEDERTTTRVQEKQVIKSANTTREETKYEVEEKKKPKQKQQSEKKEQKQTTKEQKKEREEEKQEEKKKEPVSPSPSPPPSAKPKAPKTADDFLASLTSKMKPKEEIKKPVYQRAMSAPAAPIKTPPPPETGTNKIGGMISAKQSPFSAFLKTSTGGANKDPYSYDLKSKPAPPARKKSEQDIDQQIQQFMQSRDSTRRNPLFSSTQEGFHSMGYDQSVDSNAIEDVDYYQIAKKRKK